MLITLKDHKPDFTSNPSCRLINPSKSETGIISKHILDNINKEVIKATKVNLGKSTPDVIEWFQTIPDKAQHAFVTFDVCDFYPSISEQLLKKALDYASQFTCITPQDRHIIIHVKKSLPLADLAEYEIQMLGRWESECYKTLWYLHRQIFNIFF